MPKLHENPSEKSVNISGSELLRQFVKDLLDPMPVDVISEMVDKYDETPGLYDLIVSNIKGLHVFGIDVDLIPYDEVRQHNPRAYVSALVAEEGDDVEYLREIIVDSMDYVFNPSSM